MKKPPILIAPLAILALFATAPAHALIRISPVISAQKTGSESRNNTFVSDGLGLGGGLLAELNWGMRGVEVGALYGQHKGQTDVHSYLGVSTFKLSLTALQVPVLVRAHLGSFLSLGAGGYYMKSLKCTGTSSLNGGPSTSVDTSGTGNDYGVTASAALTIPFSPLTSLLADARYNYGFKMSTGALREAQGLVGLQFGL